MNVTIKRHSTRPNPAQNDLPEKSLEEMFPSPGANAWMRKPLTRDKMIDYIARYVKD